MTAEDWEAWCDAAAVDDEPADLGWDVEEEPDPAAGEQVAWSAGFAKGGHADGLPGASALAFLADAAAGDDDRYAGATDGELDGVIAAWDRVEAHASARKHLAIAEFIRRSPEKGCEPADPGDMPARWDEFAVDELRVLLAESKAAVERMMDRAHALATRLPGTMAQYRSGELRLSKVTIIVDVTAPLDEQESRAAEDLVLGRAARLTPSGLRHAVAKAVMDVAPEKAKKRREDAAKDARVERWAEDSGNAALMGRELPPDEVLAADQRITAWAHELRTGGLEGDMDVLRARAYLDLLLDKDSRPSPEGRPAQQDVAPGGFAVRGTLTVPLADLTGLADRPGEMSGIGPVDPWLARDLAAAAARNPRTTWCVTVTDEHGHAVGHGCARPEPKSHARHGKRGKREKPGNRDRPRNPARAARDGPGPGPGRPAAGGTGPGSPSPATGPGRAAGRVRDLAAAHPRTRPGPDRRAALPQHPGLRPPVRGHRATTPASGSGTWPRSGTPPAPARSAAAPPASATSSTTSRTRRAAGPACVTATRSAGMTTGSSSSPGGTSTSSPTGPSAGPPHRGGPTSPNPPGTRSSRRGMVR